MTSEERKKKSRANAVNRGSWEMMRPLVTCVVKQKFNFHPQVCKEEGPFIVLANHNTDWDPLMLVAAFPHYMRFVASEHIFRWGLASDIIVNITNPIARPKGTTAAVTARNILETVKAGTSVAMFPEGNRSFNGVTGKIMESTGKLVRLCGVKLITYRFEGGYLTSPRWSGSFRRGRMEGRVVNVYDAETIKKMSSEELDEIIARDLYEDAYDRQSKEPCAYIGDNLAEHIERVLCVCPKCRQIGTLISSGNKIRCQCGFEAVYTEYGYLEGDEVPYHTVKEWDDWQTGILQDSIPDGDDCIFSDDDMILKELFSDHTEKLIGEGRIALYRDRLECCGISTEIDKLTGFAIHGAQTVDMSCNGHYYEISSKEVRCTRKYMTLIEYLRGN